MSASPDSSQEITRCPWCLGDAHYVEYHDREWGVPSTDESHLFELLILEGQQAGLSWRTVLHKRDAFRAAFAGFDPARMAAFDAADVERLCADAGIIRNRAKIEAKEEGRLVRDGEVETACQTACPTEAIVFGNLKDPSSRVSGIAKGARSYHVLDELNTRPAVTYLKDVTHAEMPEEGGHGEH